MYCTCSNQWILNDRNLSSSTATLPRKTHETSTVVIKKSALKSTPANRSSVTPKKSVKTVDSRLGPRFYSLPRSRAKQRPHVATIFRSDRSYQRRQSEVIPWHQPQHQQQQQLQCTCRNSCYFCNLNYPKFPQLSASTNALGYYYPQYSTLSLNNPQHQQYLVSQQTTSSQKQQYRLNTFNHHHSMINLNYNHDNSNCEPLLNENSSSPTDMSNSPVPDPPAPPLNPNCARCRFTSSTGNSLATSNGTLHRQVTTASVGSNPNMNYCTSSTGAAAVTAPNVFSGMFNMILKNFFPLIIVM